MVLNYIWLAFFAIAFVVALFKFVVFQDYTIFEGLLNSTFENAKTGFELSLGLTGVMTLWLGIMRVGEKAGVVELLAKAINPLFRRLFPQIPEKHPVQGSMMLNFAANMLGLDNAATPIGLKVMNQLQELNPDKEKASDAMIMFLVINTSGLTIIPISIMVYRAQLGAAHPADIFLPIMLSTFVSTLIGIIAVSLYQRIRIFNKTVMAWLGGFSVAAAGLIYGLTRLSDEMLSTVSTALSSFILLAVIIFFFGRAFVKKINAYEEFIEGAKEGFQVAIRIIPYLVAILVGIGVFRASGAMDAFISALSWTFEQLGIDTSFTGALPVAMMKPLSGSGARGLMIEAMNHYGPDSFVGRLSCVLQGSTDTTFYILALYFGSVGIKKSRYALTAGILADFAGIVAAIFISYLFF
ncbi:MAG: hypothetical protein PWR20_2594 [Bacteroidales bacterium]|jgi:spore maturation protein SpmA/spore maturation protein SpmB|nr:hypothetical protein [Bacteroidales bacterium]